MRNQQGQPTVSHQKVCGHKAGSRAEGLVSQGEERDQEHQRDCQSNSLGPLIQTEELDGCLREHSSHSPSAQVWAAELANHKVAALLPVTRGLRLITQPAITESLFF